MRILDKISQVREDRKLRRHLNKLREEIQEAVEFERSQLWPGNHKKSSDRAIVQTAMDCVVTLQNASPEVQDAVKQVISMLVGNYKHAKKLESELVVAVDKREEQKTSTDNHRHKEMCRLIERLRRENYAKVLPELNKLMAIMTALIDGQDAQSRLSETLPVAPLRPAAVWSTLDDKEKTIIKALCEESPLNGKELADKLKQSLSGALKQRLARLVDRGILKNKQNEGYRLHKALHQFLAAASRRGTKSD
jgi:hypothetical protein